MFKLLRAIVAAIKFYGLLRLPGVKATLILIINELAQKQSDASLGGDFYLVVGFSGAGKSTVVSTNGVLSKCANIRTDRIHDQLNQKFPFLQDDNTINGRGYYQRQLLTGWIRKELLSLLVKRGKNIVIENVGLTKKSRTLLINLAKSAGMNTTIIKIDCPEDILLERLKKRDQANLAKGEKAAWEDLYQEKQKILYQPIAENEADNFFLFKFLENDFIFQSGDSYKLMALNRQHNQPDYFNYF